MDKLEFKLLIFIHSKSNKGTCLKAIQNKFEPINQNILLDLIDDLNNENYITAERIKNDFFIKITYLGERAVENDKLIKRETRGNFIKKLLWRLQSQ